MKQWWKSKTIIIAIIQAVAGILLAFSEFYPEVGYLAIFKSLVDISLRYITYEEIK